MDFDDRVRLHSALGEPHRLRIVDHLGLTDASFSDLMDATGLDGNALSFHLSRLEEAGLIRRTMSEGDRRRRYIRLETGLLHELGRANRLRPGSVLFVCTHNSARSQFAAAQWEARTGQPAASAGSDPAESVHPLAVDVAAEFGLDISGATPVGYEAAQADPDVVISVCDRAHESGTPTGAMSVHWSIPDPVLAGTKRAFRSAFAELSARIDRLASSTGSTNEGK